MSPIKIVDPEIIKANAQIVKKHCSTFYAVVKADAYGHGMAEVIRAVDADGYCVARAQEGLAARATTSAPVLVMGYTDRCEMEQLILADVTVAVTDLSQLPVVSTLADTLKRTAKVWIALDTGMHRYGLTPSEFRRLSLPHGVTQTGVFSHLACGDVKRVSAAMAEGGDGVSYAATENLLRLGGIARVGLGLYGYGLEGVRPAMRITAKVVAVRDVPSGEYIGYGSYYRAARDLKIAVIGIGYADGLKRTVSSGYASLNGKRVPFVGSICMDTSFLDVTETTAQIGDTVTLDNAADMAQELGGIPYEYLTCWTSRVQRNYGRLE